MPRSSPLVERREERRRKKREKKKKRKEKKDYSTCVKLIHGDLPLVYLICSRPPILVITENKECHLTKIENS
jgi:hypothetical protein